MSTDTPQHAMLLKHWLARYSIPRSTFLAYRERYVQTVRIGKRDFVPAVEIARFEAMLNDAVKPTHGGARPGAGRPRKTPAAAQGVLA